MGKYFMLRNFWQNLGLTYKDIKKLPLYTTEMLIEMMRLEDQFETRDVKRQIDKNHANKNIQTHKR